MSQLQTSGDAAGYGEDRGLMSGVPELLGVGIEDPRRPGGIAGLHRMIDSFDQAPEVLIPFGRASMQLALM